METLKDYTIKAFINTVDHLGSVADKVNSFVDQQFAQLSENDLKICCIEQVISQFNSKIKKHSFNIPFLNL